MALICDTGAVFALYDADDAHHAAARDTIAAEPGPLFLPIILLAEIDYLLTTRLGPEAALDFLDSVIQGAFALIVPSPDDLASCRELMHQYRDLGVGLADASVMATAERLRVGRIFTLDERHFRAVQPRGLGHFVILPADRE